MALDSSLWLVWLGHTILSNVIVASLLAILATIVGWRLRRPAMAHGLWVLVLIKLVTPPLLHVAIPLPNLIEFSSIAVASPPSSFLSRDAVVGGGDLNQGSASKTPGRLAVENGIADGGIAKIGFTEHASEMEVGGVGQAWGNLVCISVIVLWLSVALFLMMRSLLRSIRFARVLELEGTVQADADKLGQQMATACGIKRCPRIRFVSASLSPMLFGFSRWATIVIPSGLWNELNNPQRRAMLAHELSHFRRRDHWVRGLELVVGSLFFWFPLVRFVRSQIERMEETCCDLNAVDALDNDRRLYAESLLHVVDYISQRGGRMPGFASGMRPTITLEERLRSIMNSEATGRMTQRHQSLLGSVGLVVLLIHPLASASSSSADTLSFVNLAGSERLESKRLQPMVENSHVPPVERRSFDSLPDVPSGWWSQRREEGVARTLPMATGQKMRLSFIPGVFIDVVLADKSVHRLSEASPTAMVGLQNGSRLIVGNGNGDIRLWDLESQQSVSLIGHHEGPVTTLCYHPRFGLLSGDGHGLVLQWEIQSGAIRNSWSSHRGPIQSIRCDASGEQVAIVFGDWRNHVEYSSVATMDPIKWIVSGTMDVPVALASIFEQKGQWQVIDWNGYVYPYPFQQRIGRVSKDDVSAIAFSSDTEIPVVRRVSVMAPPLFFNMDDFGL